MYLPDRGLSHHFHGNGQVDLLRVFITITNYILVKTYVFGILPLGYNKT